MDKLEYIPGDLVITNGVPLGTAKDVVYRVVSSDPSKTLKLNDGNVLKGVVRLENIEGAEFGDRGYLLGECCAWVKDIVPIPLVPAILEKNGWKNDKGDYINDSHYLHLCGKYDGYSVYKVVNDYNVVWLTGVRNVSDLQHLLFGLGLSSEMEV
jgi:hypothetical protein